MARAGGYPPRYRAAHKHKASGKPGEAFTLKASAQAFSGYKFGLRYPSITVNLNLLKRVKPRDIERLKKEISSRYPGIEFGENNTESTQSAELACIIRDWVYELQQQGNHAVFERGVIHADDLDKKHVQLVIPYLDDTRQAALQIIRTTLGISNKLCLGKTANKDFAALQSIVERSKKRPGRGQNSPRFIKAAYDLRIPFFSIAGHVFQFGYGSKHRWMHSTVTDETSGLGMQLTADKRFTAKTLRQANLPVPQQVSIRTEEQALIAAENLGFPVVIKPADLERGTGVTANIQTNEQVEQAFKKARRHSKNIVMEAHIAGEDYRLTVFQGELIWAVERRPARVVGDGNRAIGALIEDHNRDNDRPIAISNDLIEYLSLSGLDLETVPDRGQDIRLTSISNIGIGGTAIPVLDQIHPDNSQLACRAAEVLKLDIAGIDLLIPDISVSWVKSGGAICEVNAKPQLGYRTSSHLYPRIVQALIKDDGRIPIVLILSGSRAGLLTTLKSEFSEAGYRVGFACAQSVEINSKVEPIASRSTFSVGRMLVANKHVDLVLMEIYDDEFLTEGLPFDQYDFLVVDGSFADQQELVEAILPACNRGVLSTGDRSTTIDIEQQAVATTSLDPSKLVGHMLSDW